MDIIFKTLLNHIRDNDDLVTQDIELLQSSDDNANTDDLINIIDQSQLFNRTLNGYITELQNLKDVNNFIDKALQNNDIRYYIFDRIQQYWDDEIKQLTDIQNRIRISRQQNKTINNQSETIGRQTIIIQTLALGLFGLAGVTINIYQ